jgi:hypothetical protein
MTMRLARRAELTCNYRHLKNSTSVSMNVYKLESQARHTVILRGHVLVRDLVCICNFGGYIDSWASWGRYLDGLRCSVCHALDV